MTQLLIDSIRREASTQARSGTNDDAIAEMAEVLKNGGELPDVDVFFDGADYWLADGFHRVDAHEEAGEDFVEAIVRPGGEREARLFAAQANKAHGVRRTNADKRRAVEILIKDTEWRQWSDRRIAEHCGVGPDLVADVRRQLSDSDSCDTRIGKDGKKRKIPKKPDSEEEQLAEELGPEDDSDLFDPEGFADEDDEADPLEDLARPFKRATNDLLRIKRDMVTVAEDPKDGAHLHDKITRITRDIDSVKGAIRQMEPIQVCPKCKGAGCQKCASTGFWTRAIVQRNKK